MLNIPFLRRQSQPKSILDVPFSEYDPSTYLPNVVTIGKKDVKPFVPIRQVNDHLAILAAFHELRTSAGENNYPSLCESAAIDYERWVRRILPRHTGSGDIELPPLGVLMCWHTHMLNPRLFDRECGGVYSVLRGRAFPLARVAEALRYNSLPTRLSVIETEEDSTGTTLEWGSADIAAAVQRQAKFIRNMADIKWLEPYVYGMEMLPLIRGIVRYHAWLDLVHSTQGKQFLVPTLDIDLAWHTHQLQGKAYKEDSEDVLGMFLDHNDNVGEGHLGNGLAVTEKLWKERFGYDYTS